MINRPDGDHEDICPIKDERFIRLLSNLKLINEFEIHDSLVTLRQHRENLNATNNFKVLAVKFLVFGECDYLSDFYFRKKVNMK